MCHEEYIKFYTVEAPVYKRLQAAISCNVCHVHREYAKHWRMVDGCLGFWQLSSQVIKLLSS